jgi:hypothetical protein
MCNSFLDGIASVGGGFGDSGWWEGIDRVFLAVFRGNYFFEAGKGNCKRGGREGRKGARRSFETEEVV